MDVLEMLHAEFWTAIGVSIVAIYAGVALLIRRSDDTTTTSRHRSASVFCFALVALAWGLFVWRYTVMASINNVPQKTLDRSIIDERAQGLRENAGR